MELTIPEFTLTSPTLRLELSFYNVLVFKLLCSRQDSCCAETSFFRLKIIKMFQQIVLPLVVCFMFSDINEMFQAISEYFSKHLTANGEFS